MPHSAVSILGLHCLPISHKQKLDLHVYGFIPVGLVYFSLKWAMPVVNTRTRYYQTYIQCQLLVTRVNVYITIFLGTIVSCSLTICSASHDFCRLLLLSTFFLLDILQPILTRISLIRVHIVCFHDKILSEVHLNICNRHKKRTPFSGQKYSMYPYDNQIVTLD